MKYIYVFFFIYAFQTFSFSQTTIDYFWDQDQEYTIETIKKAPFKALHKTNFGFKNHKYWYKISNHKKLNEILQIESIRIDSLRVFDNANNIIIKNLKKERRPTIHVNPELNFPLYAEVYYIKEANFPFKIYDATAFETYSTKTNLVLGLYYGFICCIILLNLVLYFIFKNHRYLSFAALLFAINLSLFYSDGFFNILGLNTIFWNVYFECVLYLFLTISVVIFFNDFLNTKKGKFKPVFIFLLVIIAALYVYYSATLIWEAAVLGHTLVFLTLGITTSLSIYYNKRISISKYYSSVFTGVYIVAVYLFFLTPFGVEINTNAFIVIKVLNIIEILFILYTIYLKMVDLKTQKDVMKNEIKTYLFELEQNQNT